MGGRRPDGGGALAASSSSGSSSGSSVRAGSCQDPGRLRLRGLNWRWDGRAAVVPRLGEGCVSHRRAAADAEGSPATLEVAAGGRSCARGGFDGRRVQQQQQRELRGSSERQTAVRSPLYVLYIAMGAAAVVVVVVRATPVQPRNWCSRLSSRPRTQSCARRGNFSFAPDYRGDSGRSIKSGTHAI
jgi:hypothetical protein